MNNDIRCLGPTWQKKKRDDTGSVNIHSVDSTVQWITANKYTSVFEETCLSPASASQLVTQLGALCNDKEAICICQLHKNEYSNLLVYRKTDVSPIPIFTNSRAVTPARFELQK